MTWRACGPDLQAPAALRAVAGRRVRGQLRARPLPLLGLVLQRASRLARRSREALQFCLGEPQSDAEEQRARALVDEARGLPSDGEYRAPVRLRRSSAPRRRRAPSTDRAAPWPTGLQGRPGRRRTAARRLPGRSRRAATCVPQSGCSRLDGARPFIAIIQAWLTRRDHGDSGGGSDEPEGDRHSPG